MDWFYDRVRCCGQEAVDEVRAGDRLRLRAAIAVERRPDASERKQRTILIQREPHHVFFLGFRVRLGRVFGEAIGRTKQRFSVFSQPRQCGDDVLRILVTGGPPVRGGGGMRWK